MKMPKNRPFNSDIETLSTFFHIFPLNVILSQNLFLYLYIIKL